MRPYWESRRSASAGSRPRLTSTESRVATSPASRACQMTLSDGGDVGVSLMLSSTLPFFGAIPASHTRLREARHPPCEMKGKRVGVSSAGGGSGNRSRSWTARPCSVRTARMAQTLRRASPWTMSAQMTKTLTVFMMINHSGYQGAMRSSPACSASIRSLRHRAPTLRR